MKRFPWEMVIALAIGITLGLFYAWSISPTRYVDTTPSSLRADFKDQFRLVISAAYASTGDLERARARLTLLGDADIYQSLSAQAQQMLANGASFETVRLVAQLASDLQSGHAGPAPTSTQVVLTPLANDVNTPATGQTTIAPETEIVIITNQPQNTNSTPTPRATRTPISAPGAPFVIITQDSVCTPNLLEGLLQVNVIDSKRRPIAGIELIVTWDGGEDHFFTGFKPEIGNGYADYQMQPDISYTLRVASGGSPATNLAAPSCSSANGGSFLGGLSIVFQQP